MPKNIQTDTQLQSFHMQASLCSKSFKLGFNKCFPGVGSGKEPACQHKRHKRHQFDPWVEKSPGLGNGNPLQYSCLENPHGQRSLAIVHGVTKSWTWLKRLSTQHSTDFNSMWTESFQIYKLGLEKAEEPEIKLPTSIGSRKKQENSRKTFAQLTMPKPLTVWITNSGKFLKRWEYQTTLPVSWETCMQIMKQQLEPYIEQQTDSKLGKEYIKTVYCHLAYLTYAEYIMRNAGLDEASWNQDCLENYQ